MFTCICIDVYFLYIQNLFWKKRCWSRFTRSKVCSAWGSLVKCGSGKYHLHPLALNSLEGMVFFLHNINDNFWRLNFADVFIYSSSHNHGSEKMGSLEDVLSLQMVLFFPRPWLPWLWEEEKRGESMFSKSPKHLRFDKGDDKLPRHGDYFINQYLQ